MTVRILVGDVSDRLVDIPDESVHCVVTSPPYYGLRDYGVAGQIGLEATPEEFIERLVCVFREVRRVLRSDGTCWINMGDSYVSDGKNRSIHQATAHGTLQGSYSSQLATLVQPKKGGDGLKQKDLMGIPWMLAFALRADGWYLRQDIIWSKPNPMPESVSDRCTKSHEYVFLLSKSSRYFYDQEAILEPVSPNTHARLSQDVEAQIGSDRAHAGGKTNGRMKAVARDRTPSGWATGTDRNEHANLKGNYTAERKLAAANSGTKNNESFDAAMALQVDRRNKRSVWTVVTEGFKEAHFATYPPALIEPCILAGSPQGGVVLDPFFGAGTTGLVADRLQRDCIGIELNPEYAAMAHRRIASESPMFAEVVAE